MLDEWIERRSLRLAPRHSPSQPEMPHRFLTATGELIPLTEGVLDELKQLVAEYIRGETPPDYVPHVETADGELEPIAAESLEELVAVIRERAPERTATNQLLKELPPMPVAPRERELDWFDTADGDLPPVLADIPPETSAPPASRGEDGYGQIGQGSAPPAPRRRWPVRALIALGAVVGLALIAFSVVNVFDLSLPGVLGAGPGDTATGDLAGSITPTVPAASPAPGETQAALPPPTEAPALTLTPTVLPAEQGWLAFASDLDGDFDIYVREMATGSVTLLTEDAAADRAPAWSPDGSRLVFVSDRAGDDDLYVMDADGSNVVRLTTGEAQDHSPVWTPDGTRVIFAREISTGSDLLSFPVACMDEPEACEQALEALTSGAYDREPVVTASGEMLAMSTASFPGLPSAIGLMELGGDEVRPLEGTGATDFAPAWSPDGEWIVFVSNLLGDNDLWAMAPDGGQLVQLTQDPAADVQPRWSPGGDFIVFASDRGEGADFDFYRMDAACITATPEACESSIVLLAESPADELDPAWTR